MPSAKFDKQVHRDEKYPEEPELSVQFPQVHKQRQQPDDQRSRGVSSRRIASQCPWPSKPTVGL